MNDDQFTKLFKYIEDFRSEVNTKLDEKASQASLEQLVSTIDGFVKRIDKSKKQQCINLHEYAEHLLAYSYLQAILK